jgi:hypothetical protein
VAYYIWPTDPPEEPEFEHQKCAKCERMALCELEYGLCRDCIERMESWADDCKVDEARERDW